MVKDLPDYTKQMVIRYEGGFIGLEELAARLGSIVPWSLQGNVYFVEDFETEETEWTLAASVGNHKAIRQTRHKYSGDWALELYYENDGLGNGYAERYLASPGIQKYGVSCMMAWDSDMQRCGMTLDIYTTTKMYFVGWIYDLPTTTLSVLNESSAWEAVATDLDLSQSAFTWYPVTFIFDLVNEAHNTLSIGGIEYDISGITLYNALSTDDQHIVLTLFSGKPSPVTDYYVYFDNVAITYNVP